jgi:nucleotide-binding universal stress UspA family protein
VSGGTLLVVTMVVWLGIGVGLAVVLGRRGHDRFTWFVLGAIFGPFALVLAVDAVRHDEPRAPRIVAASLVEHEPGAVDLLVGYDGSPASKAAIDSAVGLFGVQLGRLTLATVIPFDGGAANERRARAELEHEADRLGWLAPELQVLRGRPATALAAAAVDGRFDVLAVGATGSGHAHLFGGAARQLAHESTVPVLLAGHVAPAA